MGIVTIDGIPVYQALVDSEDTGMLRISLVDDPAVQSNFVAFASAKKPLMYAVQDEEKRLVLGVVMRADFPIYRRDNDVEYYIIYKADTIRTMAEKYLKENRQNKVNLMHEDGSEQEGVNMVQYFIKGKGLEPEGFDGIADGSLFAEFHVENDDVWAAIKDGTYKGFSLEGVFDLTPERDKATVEEIVDALDGMFSKITKPIKPEKMSKVKGLLARLAEALAEETAEVKMGNVSTDKGVISWDGEEDLKAGDSVFVTDADGNRTAAPDGEYTTEDSKVVVVVDGKVAEIKDPAAEVAPAVEEETQMVQTDKGKLEWDNEEEDLKAGAAVYIVDEDGNRNPAPDGDYTTGDGKVISVADGKVASITDPKAEVDEEGSTQKMRRYAGGFSESFEDKMRKIADAIAGLLDGADFWVVDAGDDFAVAEVWDDNGSKFYRYKVSWDEAGNAVVSEPVEVVPAFVTPEERDAADANFAAVQAERDNLRAQVEEMKKTPAAAPAHETFEAQAEVEKTGNPRLDRLARIAHAK